jgi:hypothetical protein
MFRMIRRPKAEDQLRILQIEREEPQSFGPYGVSFYRALASVPLWGEPGKTITYNTLKLERLLTIAGVSIDYLQTEEEIREVNQIRLIRETTNTNEPPLTAEALNVTLEANPKAGLRITQPPEYPGLLTAHRDVPYGQHAFRSVAGLPTIQNVSKVTTGPGAIGAYSMYANGTLMMAQARFDVPMELAEQQMRDVLTF